MPKPKRRIFSAYHEQVLGFVRANPGTATAEINKVLAIDNLFEKMRTLVNRKELRTELTRSATEKRITLHYWVIE